jgi:iron complex outermembrane recepter protein
LKNISHHRHASRMANCLVRIAIVGLASPVLAQHATTSDTTPATTTAPPVPSASVSQENDGIPDIVVTAQKRSQSVNSVGMSIAAVSGDELTERGITDVASLAKIVPGFTYAPSDSLSPVYTIRGIGFYESSLASAPAVSVYQDEVPVPFPIMSSGVALDLERVEVLKGPQGTLYGQNSTGGAVNYIAAKPTSDFQAGGTFSFERFGRIDADTFLSGPLSPTLSIRVAVGTEQGGAWQYSETRNDHLGNANMTRGRITLDWDPADRLTFRLNLNGFVDQSDTQASQLISITNTNVTPSILNTPTNPSNDRQADWSPDAPNSKNNRMWQSSLRGDYEFDDAIKLTSLSALSSMDVEAYYDNDGSAGADLNYTELGHIQSVFQEIRLSGHDDRADWIVGGNYSHDSVSDFQSFDSSDASSRALYQHNFGSSDEKIRTAAGFGNLEYRVTQALTLQGAARYTDDTRSSGNCAGTLDPANGLGDLFVFLQKAVYGIANPILVQRGQCVSLLPDHLPSVTPFEQTLTEHNVSWRFGANYMLDSGTLLYANVSQGYKAGSIGTLAIASTAGYAPVKQEKVLAYETGIKAPLFDHRLQFNTAAFYYDYTDKQLRNFIFDPVFSILNDLQNVPKSRLWGIEAELNARPIAGLTLTGGASYINSKVTDDYFAYNATATVYGNFKGSPIPFTPEWTANADAEYAWTMSGDLKPFMGGGLTYHSSTNATFYTSAIPAPLFEIDSFSLLSARAGLRAPDGKWSVTLFGENLTDKYYWNTVTRGLDTIARRAGMPATFGVRLTLRTR